MIRSYLKIAWRNIYRNKAFSFTNLTGLTIGMACTMLILLWVQDELSWNKFHANHKNIYKVMVNRKFNGVINTQDAVPFPLQTALKSNFPDVVHSSIDDYGRNILLTNNNTMLRKRALSVNSDYFDLFKWKFIAGSPATALTNPGNVVLTASSAKALFGTTDAIDKMVKVDNQQSKRVSAVIEDLPANSTIQFDCVLPFDYADQNVKRASADWINCYSEVFVELRPSANIDQLNKKISALVADFGEKDNKGEFFLFPMDQWRLYSDFKNGKNAGGLIEYVRLFTIIAMIILMIACVNFMNLSTAKSEKRAKEVGIRKTLGSERKQLLLQFYTESLMFSLAAFILSVCLVYLVLPYFNTMINKQLHINILQPSFLFSALLIILFTGLVSGSYPAIYLSSFNPVKVLKGTFLPGRRAGLPRKVLVILQFIISIFLISATILVYKQIQHVKNRDLGYNPDNLISIPSSPDADKNADVIKNELNQTNMVASITRTSAPVTEIWNYSPAPDWKGKPSVNDMIMSAMSADAGFAETLGTKIIQGRDFSNLPADSSSIILNKSALEVMQLKDPVGMQMHYGNRNLTVIGVTDNVVMSSPFAPVMPMMLFFGNKRSAFFVIRLKKEVAPQAALAKIGGIFKKYNPEYPFEYTFTDQEFNKKFVNEELISKLTNIFAGLAIFICCLGLSGLTAFTIEKRFKEIGIRKVLGASVQQLLLLISKEFLLLVFLAFLISVPIAWWLLNNWLQNYEYRISIDIWLFVASGISILFLTLVIVCMSSVKAAMTNPIKNLRSE